MVFTRTLSGLNTFELLPGRTDLTFVDLGGSLGDPFPVLMIYVNNVSEATTYDFETDEVSGVATIKYSYQGSVMRKQEITDISTSSPILIMQDEVSPTAYAYVDDTDIGYPDLPQHTKSGRQEINYRNDLRMPAVQFAGEDETGVIVKLGGVYRHAIKGNWHFFSDAIICDTISFFVRRRIKSGLYVESYNFL